MRDVIEKVGQNIEVFKEIDLTERNVKRFESFLSTAGFDLDGDYVYQILEKKWWSPKVFADVYFSEDYINLKTTPEYLTLIKKLCKGFVSRHKIKMGIELISRL